MDQKQVNRISGLFGVLFLILGGFVLILGFSLLMGAGSNGVNYLFAGLLLISGFFLLAGGRQNLLKAKEKKKAVEEYKEKVNLKLSGEKDTTDVSDNSQLNEYVPDIIGVLEYEKEEWKLMKSSETRRRLKEGIWVSLLIGILGGYLLMSSRGVPFLAAFLFALVFGLVISYLKVLMSGSLFRMGKENQIVLTTNALIINGKFKTINDDTIALEYVTKVRSEEKDFLEFSIQWKTRRGITNDQFRIYIPERSKDISEKVIEYYKIKGVKTSV